jgi:hypothetical protein
MMKYKVKYRKPYVSNDLKTLYGTEIFEGKCLDDVFNQILTWRNSNSPFNMLSDNCIEEIIQERSK